MSAYQGQRPERPPAPASGTTLLAWVGGLGARIGGDLVPRIISGVVIAIIALVTIWAGPAPFAVLASLVLAVAAWEWGRMVRGHEFDLAMPIHIAAVVGAVIATGLGRFAAATAILAAGAALAGLLSLSRNPVLTAVGVVVTGLPGMALLWLRNDADLGAAAVYFIIVAVAATDISAYFSGRLIGGPKLWPRVSPNKTWAGLIGAVVAAGLAGAITARLVPGGDSLHLAVLGAALAVAAQAGDLAESALKRYFGTKDASHLIPGHGGFMDRVDGLVTASVLAASCALWLDASAPARALLTW